VGGSKSSKRIYLFGIILVLALLLSGLVFGPIGASILGTPSILSKPEIHLVGEPIIPNESLAESITVIEHAPEGEPEVEHVFVGELKAVSGDTYVVGSKTWRVKSHDGIHGEPKVGDTVEVHAAAGLVQSKFYVTNTMLASWITIVFLVLLFFFGTRRLKEKPGRFQSILEGIIEVLLNFTESVVGKAKSRVVFPIVATIFLYVLFNAWLSLIPLYAAIGFISPEGHLERVIMRNAGTDINEPLSIALVSFVMAEFWGIRYVGAGKYLGTFFNFRNLLRGKVFMGLVDLAIGLLEVLSHFIRVISFTFRLFGNMTAGKILLLVASFLIPFVFSTIFIVLEIIVGFVQALVFAGLTLVFAAIAMTHHGEEEHGEAHS